MENLKIKRMLKKLFENREFNLSFEDEIYLWNGYDDEVQYEEYSFKFRMFVSTVVGEGSRTVSSITVVIEDIKKDGEDYYYDWVGDNYDNGAWYIKHLDYLIKDEYFEDLPFSIYLNFYGWDEKY